MSWRDDLRRVTLPGGRRLIGATFRGVPFFVESAQRTGGRRIVTHEFPMRADPYVEDLGRHARVFGVEAYVIGDGYVGQRDQLLAALEDVIGPGELVHPYYGIRRAICSGVTARETIQDGRMAVLSIEFTETPAQEITATDEPDLGALVGSSADAAQLASAAQFVDDYDVAGMPSFSLASAERALASLSAGVGVALGPVARNAQELALLAQQVDILTAQASSLVRQPADVLGAFGSAVGALASAVLDAPGAVLAALMDAYAADAGPAVIVTTATRLREAANQTALVGALRRSLAIEAARHAPRVPFATLDDAVAARDQVAAAIEEQLEGAGDDVYAAMAQLRSDLVRAVPGEARLASVSTIAPRVPVPSLVLSYQLYGSVDGEADLIARNRAPHPGFLSGSLQVLSDV